MISLDPTKPFAGPYRVAQLVDGAWRGCRDPGEDISDLPKDVQDRIAAEWTDEVIAAYRAGTQEPPAGDPKPDPILAELDSLKSRLEKLEADSPR
jgi:hypothetical protein